MKDINTPTPTVERTQRQYTAVKEHLYSELNGEAVVLSLATGKYYGLNAVGVAIWRAIQTPASVQHIKSALMEEYDVDTETCSREVSEFLRRMLEEGLIEAKDETLD